MGLDSINLNIAARVSWFIPLLRETSVLKIFKGVELSTMKGKNLLAISSLANKKSPSIEGLLT
jgi:hypothetical protein